MGDAAMLKRRLMLSASGLCINNGNHGKATSGKLCRACRLIHRGVVSSMEEARRFILMQPKLVCSKCHHRDASKDYKTCEICRDKDRFRARERSTGNQPGKPHLPREEDQVVLPKPIFRGPGTMHTCAVCIAYTRCHHTQLDPDGPPYWVCVDCNSKSAEVKNDFRGIEIDDERVMSGGTRALVTASYNRIVPDAQRGGFAVPFMKRGPMRGFGGKKDLTLAIQDAAARPRLRLLRALHRFDGWADSGDLLLAAGAPTVACAERNSFTVELGRLLRDRVVERTRLAGVDIRMPAWHYRLVAQQRAA